MTTTTQEPTTPEVQQQLEAWLAGHWTTGLTVGDWWRRLAEGRWTAPSLPLHSGGRGWPAAVTRIVRDILADRKALGPPEGLGLALAAPTIARFGSEEQIHRLVMPILTGEQAWCQLFSEPDAGSDLASLTTKAVSEVGGWRVYGTKIWSSLAQHADWGMLLARTDPTKPKHRGITWFAIAMDQPGVEVRPIRDLSGDAFFNEVILDGAHVPDSDVIGPLHAGWQVALTTLSEERSGLSGGLATPMSVLPGRRAGFLDRSADAMALAPPLRTAVAVDEEAFGCFLGLARSLQRHEDPVVRQELVRLWSLIQVDRIATRWADGQPTDGGAANLSKMRFSELYRVAREVGNLIIGPWGTLLGSQSSGEGDLIQRITLFSPAPAIAGGTDQIQRNIVAERLLGLPREAQSSGM
jgi:alkylation response protein AidB-like acyl-CoA dehydrogenase